MHSEALLCEVFYLDKEIKGEMKRWGVVVGYEEIATSLSVYSFKAKPTKRQLRRIKRNHRL